MSFSQGAKWKALIKRYIGIIPPSGDTPAIEHNASAAPPPSTPVSSAMTANVGAAARYSQSAALLARLLPFARIASQPCMPIWASLMSSLLQSCAATASADQASLSRKAASPASDTATHFGSGAAPGTYMSCQFHHL